MPRPLPADRVYLSIGINEPALSEDARYVYYIKIADGRRNIIRHELASGLAEAITTEPAPKGGIGYGGALFSIKGQTLVYAARDNRLWRLSLDTAETQSITPAYEGVAAPEISPCGKFVVFLAEQGGRCNVMLSSLDGRDPVIKLSDDPWYAFNPTFSADGARVAWQEWDSQHMPWDESRIVIATFAQRTFGITHNYELLPLQKKTIAKPKVSYASPRFSPDGLRLAYTSDETGWRSIFVSDANGDNPQKLNTGDGEMGSPGWVPGQIAMRWQDEKTLFAVRRHQSQDTLLQIDVASNTHTAHPQEYTLISELQLAQHLLVFVGATPTQPASLVTIDLTTRTGTRRATTGIGMLDASSLSVPKFVQWKTTNNEDCFGILSLAVGYEDKMRPLVVAIHGGPTAERSLSWDAQAQYFATRGWHFLQVNHRGSTGFGRAYQDKLNENWGIVDVEDARSGAQFLIDQGIVDAARVVITGGSAGGYTTLYALTQQPDFWAGGVSLYGIGNLYDLKQGSHRFEVNYEIGLIGPLPETGPRWKDRSAMTHRHKVKAAVLLFHGQEDAAVPYQQSVEFAEAIRKNGGVAELILFPDEGHGFVKEKNRKEVLEKTMRFLDKYVLCKQ